LRAVGSLDAACAAAAAIAAVSEVLEASTAGRLAQPDMSNGASGTNAAAKRVRRKYDMDVVSP
jgi:hypothetical protein